MAIFITVFLFTIVIALIVYVYYKYVHRLHKCLEKYPGPTPTLLTGTAYTFKGISPTEYLSVASQMAEQFGPVVKHSLGLLWPTRAALLISDPNLIELILTSPRILKKTPNYYFLRRWLQDGLLLSTGAKWKQRRKIITKTFRNRILEKFIKIFNSSARLLVKKLEEEAHEEKGSTDIYEFVTLCALDIICETAMGTNVNAQNDTNSKYVFSVQEMRRIVTSRATSILKMFDGTYPFFGDYYKELKAIEILHDYSDFVINRRREELDKHTNDGNDNSTKSTKSTKQNFLLDALLKSKVLLKHEEIREEVDTIIFGGHDTSASTLSFALYALANYPKIQEKALEELDVIFKDDPNRMVRYKDIKKMKYLGMVIQETLRMYPSAPLYGRELEEDLLNQNEVVLPKGVHVGIFVYGLHRNPQIWPEPEKFDPNRFLLENTSKRHPFAYVPFSAGPRNCVGQKYAMFEMKVILAEILRNFELLPAVPEHKLVLVPEVVLKSINGVRIRLKKRSGVQI